MTEPGPASSTFAETLITAGVALTGILTTALLAWMNDLSYLARQTKDLDYLNKRVDLWKKILDLQQDLASSKAESNTLFAPFLRDELGQVINYFVKSYDIPFEQRHFPVNRFRRWLLLYKPLCKSSWSTWLLRTFFYLAVGCLLEIVIKLPANIAEDSTWTFLAVVPFGFFLLVSCIMLRRVCLAHDEKNYNWECMWRDHYKRMNDESKSTKEEPHFRQPGFWSSD